MECFLWWLKYDVESHVLPVKSKDFWVNMKEEMDVSFLPPYNNKLYTENIS